MSKRLITFVGIVGVPAIYGGFETLVDNLVRFHDKNKLDCEITVFCSGKTYKNKEKKYLSANLIYLPLKANGLQSVIYDALALFLSVLYRADTILVLGVSGAVFLPFVRFFSSATIITNIDGIEWRRDKWNNFTKWFLRFSEKLAVRFSDVVIADNKGISEYVNDTYKKACEVIVYGGDHAVSVVPASLEFNIPEEYSLSICRIEPENNVHMILESFARRQDENIVFVGNWKSSSYGMDMKRRYKGYSNIVLLDPIYDVGKLATLRSNAKYYIHGHSAGGTNPSLVEAMFFDVPIIAYDCVFNRYTTDNKALYFRSVNDLVRILSLDSKKTISGLRDLAINMYTWGSVSRQYFSIFEKRSK